MRKTEKEGQRQTEERRRRRESERERVDCHYGDDFTWRKRKRDKDRQKEEAEREETKTETERERVAQHYTFTTRMTSHGDRGRCEPFSCFMTVAGDVVTRLSTNHNTVQTQSLRETHPTPTPLPHPRDLGPGPQAYPLRNWARLKTLAVNCLRHPLPPPPKKKKN